MWSTLLVDGRPSSGVRKTSTHGPRSGRFPDLKVAMSGNRPEVVRKSSTHRTLRRRVRTVHSNLAKPPPLAPFLAQPLHEHTTLTFQHDTTRHPPPLCMLCSCFAYFPRLTLVCACFVCFCHVLRLPTSGSILGTMNHTHRLTARLPRVAYACTQELAEQEKMCQLSRHLLPT